MIVALVGNPNSGKTTTFNNLTGASAKVGNWAGVTVEKKVAKIRTKLSEKDITFYDLPGVYHIDSHTPEEEVTKNSLDNDKIDVIINVIDTTNIERAFELTQDLLGYKIPMVIALNKSDMAAKKGIKVDVKGLEQALGTKIIEITSSKNKGTKELVDEVVRLGNK